MVVDKYYVLAHKDEPNRFFDGDGAFTEQIERTCHYYSAKDAQDQIDFYKENADDEEFSYMVDYSFANSLMVVGVKIELF